MSPTKTASAPAIVTPSLVLETVAAALRIPAADLRAPERIDDQYRMTPRDWTPVRLARGMVLHWIKVRCPLAPEYGIGQLLAMDPAAVDGEREAFRERLRRNPELRKSAARIEEALKAVKAKGKVRL